MAGATSGRKGPTARKVSKVLRPSTDAKRQSNRRKRLTDAFGPAVDIHMSEDIKTRLDALIAGQYFIKPDDSISSETFGRCAALAELINQFYFDSIIRPKTDVGKEIAKLYEDIWAYRVIDRITPEAIAVELNKANRRIPVFTKAGGKWLNQKWNVEWVTEMCETEYILDLISQAEKAAQK